MAGVRAAAFVLLALHIVHSVLFDNPRITVTKNAADEKLRAIIFDLIIMSALIMAAGIRLKKNENEENKKDAKVKNE